MRVKYTIESIGKAVMFGINFNWHTRPAIQIGFLNLLIIIWLAAGKVKKQRRK